MSANRTSIAEHERIIANYELMRHIKCKGSSSCSAHPNIPFCSCPVAMVAGLDAEIATNMAFVLSWEGVVTEQDACFLYTGDEKSTAIFQAITGDTPEEFARGQYQGGLNEYFDPAFSLQGLINAMLLFWSQRSKQWREKALFKSKEDFRASFALRKRRMRDDGVVTETFGLPDHWASAHVKADPMTYEGAIKFTVLKANHCHVRCGEKERVREALTVRLVEMAKELQRK